jgi:hypothetical protein
LWAGVLGLFSVSEDHALSPRQARTITAAPRWRRWATLLHGPGATRGRLAFIALVALSLGVGLLGVANTGREVATQALTAAWILACYSAALFVLGDWLYRGACRTWLDTTALRRGFLLVLIATFCLGPILAALVLDPRGLEASGVAMISPIMGVVAAFGGTAREHVLPLILVSLSGAGSFALLIVQGLRLHIATQRIAARDDDRNPRAG